MTATRVEYDSLGPDNVPADRLWGAHHEFGRPLTIEEVPIPQPGTGQVLVKVHACGMCGTDLHAASGDWPAKPKPPFIPGHEGVGHVAAVGPGVTHLREGDRVGVPWLRTACGHCKYCWSGWETLCEAQQNTGYSAKWTTKSSSWPAGSARP